MRSPRRRLGQAMVYGAFLVLGACGEDSHSPPSRAETPVEHLTTDEPGNLAPLDLVYVCGNKFLATNAHRRSVHLTWRVLGTPETGSITLSPGPTEDPGHSETELETAGSGILELYQDGVRVVRRRNLNRACGAPAVASLVAGASAAEAGSWTQPFPWPSIAVHLSLLPTGRVLSWGLAGQPVVWDPATGDFTEVPSQAELFCAGHSLLPDGRVLVSGGHLDNDRGIPDVSIFSPSTGAWTQSTPMRRGRWYPTNTTLPNGSVVILAGRDQVGDEVAEPEVWSPSGIRQLGNASLVLPYYPRTFVAPNGLVFYAGEQSTSRFLSTSGNGAWTTVGERRYGARPYGAAVMYEMGKILYAGGGRTTNTAEIIDLNAAAPTWQWTGSMAFPRRNLNATVLPNGEVLVTGGSSHPSTMDVTQAVRASEMWSPATGLWTTMASNSVSRTYHSTTLLLPDGRVLHTGSGDGAGMPPERNAEIYSPPYLSRGPRPSVTDAPGLVGWGTTFSVATPDAAAIARVSLIRLGSVTHAFDMNQRLLWLAFTRDPGGLTITAPANGAHAPPGHYMLFLVDGDGVPSVGSIVRVGAVSEPGPGPNSAPTAAFLVGCGVLNCNFADKSTDPDGNLSGWEWSFGDGATSSARDPSHAYVAGGTYTARLTARDSDGESATLTRQLTVPGPTYPLGLTLTTSSTSTSHKVVLKWTRAQGSAVYVYRNGLVLQSTPNDGQQAFSKNASGAATYIFKVCEAGTTICSNPAVAVFGGGSPPDNATPHAAFTPSCDAGTCRFTDGSTDPDGTVTAWQWSFGDGSTSTQRNPSHGFPAQGAYEVRLTVTDDRGGQGSVTRQVTVDEPGPNQSPVADFTFSCTDLACSFTDGSTDADGSVVLWSWSFGDGTTSSSRDPSRTYASPGTYGVTLAVTDDDGATHQRSASVAVTSAPPAPITLTVSGRTDAERHYITHLWSGATGTSVDLYRNGKLIQTTPNDGRHTTAHKFKGTATWRVRVCGAGSTTVCSPERTITLSN